MQDGRHSIILQMHGTQMMESGQMHAKQSHAKLPGVLAASVHRHISW